MARYAVRETMEAMVDLPPAVKKGDKATFYMARGHVYINLNCLYEVAYQSKQGAVRCFNKMHKNDSSIFKHTYEMVKLVVGNDNNICVEEVK